MIYFDNSATTIQKPPEVASAVSAAITSLGNPGRSFHAPALSAARVIYDARREMAALVSLDDPLGVAFTSGATESLNLVINSLISPGDEVVTTVLEHNSVLRPLYRLSCRLSFVSCNEHSEPDLNYLETLLSGGASFLVCTHSSNLTGTVLDVREIYRLCRRFGVRMILDVSQTLGAVEVRADMADILCFTGHKALFGPQGTGGIIMRSGESLSPVKTGGSGSDSFSARQSSQMPEVFEAGTQNAHSIAGLLQGASFVNRTGVRNIMSHGETLLRTFLTGIAEHKNIRVYGDSSKYTDRLPVVSLNLGDMPSDELAYRLWEGWGIATRPGSHCAPLLHRYFNTEAQGMVRFSFSYFNTMEEILIAVRALNELNELI